MTLAQLVSHDRADRCDVRGLRARQAGDHIHADDRDLQQAAAQMTDERVDEFDQTQADAAALHDESSENKEGNRQQNVIPCPVHHVLRQHHERGGAAAPEVDGCGQQQDEPDGDARENGDHEKDESRDDRPVVPEDGQPLAACRGGRAGRQDECGQGRERRLAMRPPKAIRGIDCYQRHPQRKRDRDQRCRKLQDRGSFAPVGGDEFGRDDAGQPRCEKNDDVGEREADPFAPRRQPSEDQTDMRMLAPSIRDRAPDERHDRQGQPRRLVRP